MVALIVIIAIIAILVIAVIAIYNGLVTARIKVDNAWSQIDVQLQRRFDLIPNFVETVKGYMTHESEKLLNLEVLGQMQEVYLKKQSLMMNYLIH